MICAAKEDLVGSIKVDGPLDGVFVVGTTRASLPAVWRAKSHACKCLGARRDNLTLSPGGQPWVAKLSKLANAARHVAVV